MSLDKKIFKNKTLSDLFEEIYENRKKKDNQITGLIEELKPLIEEIGDATLVVPMIKEYLEIGVKNDEHLIKMAAIIQRLETAKSSGNSEDIFSDLGIERLIEEASTPLPEVSKEKERKDSEDPNLKN